ncbi:MAG: hypothetical protein E4H03_04575 [Myxococcales bacterium]|nr:MAG: hypothetical protein E4H03_04575 [Myxococcales bacterium]
MTAEDNSKLLTEPEARFEIRYRDPNKVPVLEGDLAPAPLLIVDPSLTGCPVCGNTEIDQGESCDDGNTTSGDGCRDDCQAELCIAQTPGFPGVSLCDDGDACTADVCDPVAGCSNPISCEEGVACTVDVCVAGSCEHTPDDTLCEDANDCTIDVCDAASGCGHTGLTGDPCEDGDMCTVTGTCQSGSCVVTDVSLTENHKITAKLKAGAANDLLKVKLDMPCADFAADPSVSGATLELFDENDASIYAATLGAADWVDKRGDGRQFTFADTQGPSGPANGVTKAKIKRIDKKGVARTVVTMKGSEIPGAANQLHMSLSLLFGLDPATDDCLSARRVPCKVSATRTSCR